MSQPVIGQKIRMIQQSAKSDSSFYHVKKINSNEFWAGGEYGILKSIDTLGNISTLNFPNRGLDILKIERTEHYIFLITANAVIYRYDIKQKRFLTKEFPAFKNKCFYDLIVLQDGRLMVCGGDTGITEEKKKIPKGFIATIDQNLEEINVVWKSTRKFVWSLYELDNQEVIAATFNGLNTQVIKSNNTTTWEKAIKVPGLVHEITSFDNQIWYCGAKSFRFKKAGILGNASKRNEHNELYDTGCIWSIDNAGGNTYAVTRSGELLRVDEQRDVIEYLKIKGAFTLYDIEKISETKLLIVGNGKSVYIVDLNG